MFFKLIIVFLAGTAAGFINVNAGGGSLLTLPLLILMGLPSAVANGTNRIAILTGALSASAKFRSKRIFDWNLGLLLSIPCVAGAVIGTCFAIQLSDKVFNTILSIVMIMVVVVVTLDPAKRWKALAGDFTLRRKIIAVIVFFIVGFYGGFIQVGIGFLLMAALSLLTGFSLIRINSLKVFIVVIYTVFSLSIFILNGKVDMPLGLTLAAGSAVGGWLGTAFAVKKGDNWIRVILLIAVLAMAVKLSGVMKFIF